MSDYRTAEEVLKSIRDLEERYDLFQYQVDGWCVWEILRFPVFIASTSLPLASGPAGYGRWRRIVSWLCGVVRWLPTLLFPPRARILVKTFSSALREMEGDRFKDVYFDDLLKGAGPSFKIETVNNRAFADRRRSALIRINMDASVIDMSAGVLARLWSPSAVALPARRISELLRQELGLEAFTVRRVSVILGSFCWARRLYSWLLGRMKPEYVFVADSGEWGLLAASRERGVKVVEFQHGLFDPLHPNVLPAYARRHKEQIPGPFRLMTYGPYWTDQLRRTGFYDEELFTSGNVLLDSYRMRREALQTGEAGRPCTLVLTTQGLDQDRLIAMMKEFLALARERMNVHLHIKMHPGYEASASAYEAAFGDDGRVTIVAGSALPTTFELLAGADFHLSISSSCHYDALGLGTPTIILALSTHDVVMTLKEAGHAFLAATAEELLDIIEKNRNYVVPKEVSAWYYAPDALHNIRKELGL